MSLWRNRLARSTVNRKVGGSSPPGSGVLRVTGGARRKDNMLQYCCHGDIEYWLGDIEIKSTGRVPLANWNRFSKLNLAIKQIAPGWA